MEEVIHLHTVPSDLKDALIDAFEKYIDAHAVENGEINEAQVIYACIQLRDFIANSFFQLSILKNIDISSPADLLKHWDDIESQAIRECIKNQYMVMGYPGNLDEV